MKTRSPIVVVLTLVVWPALPSWVNAACPAAQTYFFSGRGDVVLQQSANATPCDGGIALNGDLTTTNGVSCTTGCPTTATATVSLTEVTKTGACGFPNSTHPGGFDGISCDQLATMTIQADCKFEPPLSPSGTPTRTLNNITITSSVPSPSADTPASVCASYIGSTLETISYIAANQKAFDMVATHGTGCSEPVSPCPTQDIVVQFTPAIDIQGNTVLDSVAP